MHAGEQIRQDLMSLWSAHDNLLQSYRGLFLGSQSVVFSIAVFVAAGSSSLFLVPLFVLGVYLLWLWRRIYRSRGYDEWYFHWQLLKMEKGENLDFRVLQEFEAWHEKDNTTKKNLLASDEIGKRLMQSRTRKALDSTLPEVFAVLWVFLLIITIANAAYRTLANP